MCITPSIYHPPPPSTIYKIFICQLWIPKGILHISEKYNYIQIIFKDHGIAVYREFGRGGGGVNKQKRGGGG